MEKRMQVKAKIQNPQITLINKSFFFSFVITDGEHHWKHSCLVHSTFGTNLMQLLFNYTHSQTLTELDGKPIFIVKKGKHLLAFGNLEDDSCIDTELFYRNDHSMVYPSSFSSFLEEE